MTFDLGENPVAQDTATSLIACEYGQKMKVPADAIGKTASCVKCGGKIKITEDLIAQASGAADPPPDPPRSGNGNRPAPVPGNTSPIVSALLAKGIADAAGLQEAQLVQQDVQRTDWETLIAIGRVSSKDFHDFMSEQEGMTNIDLKNYSIPGDVLDFVPGELVRKGRLFPVDKLGKLLTIAMACPIDAATVEEVESTTGLKIKVMLCNLDDLRRSIHMYYPEKREQVAHDDTFSKDLAKEFNELLEMNPVARKAFDLEPLAPLKASVDRALQAGARGDAALAQLKKVVSQDLTCASLILSPANSAAYGFPKRVDNLDMATAVLGADVICRILQSIPAEDYMALDDDFDYKKFWTRSIFCAVASQAIATTMESQRVQTAYAAGLLHDIGRLGMHKILPHSYVVVTKDLSATEIFAAEERVYHIAHTEVGYMLARKWNLPSGITEPIRYQRDPAGAGKSREVVSTVALATLMADAYEIGGQPELKEQGELLETLNMSSTKATMIYKKLTEKGCAR